MEVERNARRSIVPGTHKHNIISLPFRPTWSRRPSLSLLLRGLLSVCVCPSFPGQLCGRAQRLGQSFRAACPSTDTDVLGLPAPPPCTLVPEKEKKKEGEEGPFYSHQRANLHRELLAAALLLAAAESECVVSVPQCAFPTSHPVVPVL